MQFKGPTARAGHLEPGQCQQCPRTGPLCGPGLLGRVLPRDGHTSSFYPSQFSCQPFSFEIASSPLFWGGDLPCFPDERCWWAVEMGKERMWEKLLRDRPLEVGQEGFVEDWVSHPAGGVPCREPTHPRWVWELRPLLPRTRELLMELCPGTALLHATSSGPDPWIDWGGRDRTRKFPWHLLFLSLLVHLCAQHHPQHWGSRHWRKGQGKVRLVRLSLQRAPKKRARKYRTSLSAAWG